ncbi:hypothetical protein [Streptomyces rishiriensis]|uniref:Uncharacterized protein n=1 Tax=Streptomyces rishiriensis TaxID=68264 RepID=A0ABU0NUK4_STRRH|nr:hypothetical protein [Streptomyces rishiriensis]MDQ0582383.1 hypothetical protein [Streptomyces rishiriensis]
MTEQQLADEVVTGARERATLAHLDAGLSDAEARKIVRELKAGALRSGIKVEELTEKLPSYIVGLVGEMDVDLPAPDTKSAFWSWALENHPQLGEGEKIRSMHVAAAYADVENAASHQDAVRYLEGTPGGQKLGELHLWDKTLHGALGLDAASGEAMAGSAWDALSQKYAAKTENEALFFMAELNPGTVAYQTESRQLRQDGKLDIIQFMYPAPTQKYTDLAPETQELLASQVVRAQVHTFPYEESDPKYTPLTKAGHLDLQQLAALPTPEAQRAAVLEVCARVATMDGPARSADVEKLVEEIKVLRPDHEITLPSVEDQQWAAEQRGPELDSPAGPPAVAVSTHGQYLPGVTVNARTGPAPLEPLTLPAPGAAAVQAHSFLPGVTPQAKSVVAPGRTDTPAAPSKAPPSPEQSNDAGRGM